MGVSQFRVYTSIDVGGPGLLSGTSGNLLTILDAILVNGYTGHTAAGWTKPFANSGNLGCYKQNGGAGCTLFVNDNGPNVTSTVKEAWITGWEVLTALTGPVGVGVGQFPFPQQVLTTGHLVVRKSETASATGRSWVCFADATTVYFYAIPGDAASTYDGVLVFGDYYSLYGSSARCMIVGQVQENSSATGSASFLTWDAMCAMNSTNGNYVGHYTQRGPHGYGLPMNFYKTGNMGVTVMTSAFSTMCGSIPIPNQADGQLYVSQISLLPFVNPGGSNQTGGGVFGRVRGMWQICHAATKFSDGQVLSLGGSNAGKQIRIVKYGNSGSGGAPNQEGFFGMEISNTVETN